VVDAKTNREIPIQMHKFLSKKQLRTVTSKPDVIWQFAQRLKKTFAEQNQEVKVYALSYVRVNGRELRQLIDPNVDLANVKWEHFKHSDWILPSDLDKKPEIKK
jgi:hypothetical protein